MFKGLSVAKNYLRPKRVPLRKTDYKLAEMYLIQKHE